MKKNKKILRIVIIVIGITVVLFAGVRVYLQTLLPDVDGELRGGAIKAKVTVIRDNWGIPHIEAQNAHDAYYAFGFTVAQDRLFQMELQRRLAKGQLAEILGPELLKTDRQFRTYLFRHTGEKMIKEAIKSSPESIEIFKAFLDGVNFFIETEPLPVEFTLLGIKPEKFTLIDSASFLGYMNFSFMEGIVTDSLATILKQKFPRINVEEVFPGYKRENPVTIMESQAYYSANTGGKSAELIDKKSPSGNSSACATPELVSGKNLTLLIQDVMKTANMMPTFIGSNSWVIGPSRSKSGSALLANDPHVTFSNPGVWYEAHMKYPGQENYGYFVPLVPFPFMAHNKDRAWAITMFENDDVDLYAETFKSGDDSRVMYKKKWVKAKVLTETIHVKGQKDNKLTIRITPHGPIITDFIDGYTGKPVSMCATYNQTKNPVLDFLHMLISAKTMPEFEKALSLLAAPGLNVSYTDRAGNIAWWAVGKIPVRPSHVNSKSVLDGASGRDDYLGYLPFKKNPHLVNPASGIIITANNLSTRLPLGPVKDLEGYWQPSDRAARITQLLSAKKKWSLEDLKITQTDVKAFNAKWILQTLSEIIETGKKKNPLSPLEEEAFDTLKKWNGVYSVDSSAPSLYEYLTYHVLREGVGDEFGKENFRQFGDIAEHWNFFKAFIKDNGSPLWDNVNTKETEVRSEIMVRALKATVSELGEKHGFGIKNWSWGKICTLEFVHPIGMKKPFNLIFNIGPFSVPGGYEVVNIFGCRAGKHDYKVQWGPSTRRLIDYADVNNSFTVLPSGNSGNFLSPNYQDQVKMYLQGHYRKVNFTDEQIRANKRSELIMLPK